MSKCSLLVLRSIASLCCHYNDHITRIRVSMSYAARCPISPRSCRRWKKFCHSSMLRRFSQSWLVSQFQRWELWRCRSLKMSMRIFFLQDKNGRLHLQFTSLSIMMFTRVIEVTRFPCNARVKVDINVSMKIANVSIPRIRVPHRKSCERKINEKPTNE